jgi:DNA-binding transcriptional LysR family regulator
LVSICRRIGSSLTSSAAAGLGIAYVPERSARPFIESGKLAAVLDDWCP